MKPHHGLMTWLQALFSCPAHSRSIPLLSPVNKGPKMYGEWSTMALLYVIKEDHAPCNDYGGSAAVCGGKAGAPSMSFSVWTCLLFTHLQPQAVTDGGNEAPSGSTSEQSLCSSELSGTS